MSRSKRCRRVRSKILLALPVGLFALPAWGVQYTLTDLGTLGGTSSAALGINSSGQIVGWSTTAGNVQHAFVYSGGVMTDLGTLGGSVSRAYDINDSGQIVGYAQTTGNAATRAFLYSGGVMSDLGTLGGNYSEAYGINNSGQIVGYGSTGTSGDTLYRAFRYSGGVMTDLGTLGGGYSSAYGINSSGQVVGYSQIKGGSWPPEHAFRYSTSMTDMGTLGGSYSYAYAVNDSGHIVGDAFTTGDAANRAFLYNGTSMIDLGTLGGSASYARALNSSGDVVGMAKTAANASRAFLYSGGSMVDLNNRIAPDTGWILTHGQAINDNGLIVGYGTLGGQTRAYLLTPSPSWLNTSNTNNAWGTGGNWDLGAAPTAALDATFDRGAAYQIAFTADGVANKLVVKNDQVTLALDTRTLTVADSITIGATGQLTVFGGTLQAKSLSATTPGGVAWNSGTLVITGTGGLSSENLGANVVLGATHALTVNNTLTIPQSATFDSRLATLSVGGMNVSGAAQVGNLDGASGASSEALSATGITTINANGTLTATRVRQQALVLHGDAGNSAAQLTITESLPGVSSGTPSGDDAMVSIVRSVAIANDGLGAYFATVDLTNNDLIIDYTGGSSPLAAIEAMVKSGYNGGTWTGKGLTSSIAAANAGSYSIVVLDNAERPTPFTTFDGVDIGTSVVIVKFSWVADLDLDGTVSSNDAIVFANNYSEGALANHRIGDLNYNGVFDSNDAILFANAYNESLPHLPEPSSLAMLVISGAALLGRRRR